MPGTGPHRDRKEHNEEGLKPVTGKKKHKFSVVKAVKANARERVGQPRSERIIEDKPHTEKRTAKHRKTLGEMLVEDSR